MGGPYPSSHPLADVTPWNEVAANELTRATEFLVRFVFRARVADVAPLPPGPLILAPNHRSFLDPMLAGTMVSRRVFFLMHAKYYEKKSMYWFYRTMRCIPVEDGDNRRALRAGSRVLEAGRVLGIFPEGTISPDGRLGPAQPGMAWLARHCDAPVMPVYISGTREALQKGSKRVRPVRLGMRTGELMWARDYGSGRDGALAFTAAVMKAIAELGGESPA